MYTFVCYFSGCLFVIFWKLNMTGWLKAQEKKKEEEFHKIIILYFFLCFQKLNYIIFLLLKMFFCCLKIKSYIIFSRNLYFMIFL